MKVLNGFHSASKREDPHSNLTLKYEQQIKSLQTIIDDDKEYNTNRNCGIAFVVFKRKSVAKFIRENANSWMKLPSLQSLDGISSPSLYSPRGFNSLSTLYCTKPYSESEIIWSNLFK